jgi:2-keto-4-pentenoate hydratase/2-oxohepta-3-ene-1,7-dioic acid hydratase in catechol pathway
LPGDEVVIRVEGLGDLRNPVISEADAAHTRH